MRYVLGQAEQSRILRDVGEDTNSTVGAGEEREWDGAHRFQTDVVHRDIKYVYEVGELRTGLNTSNKFERARVIFDEWYGEEAGKAESLVVNGQ